MIDSYEFKNNVLKVVTKKGDSFVYPNNKFSSVDSLKKEIEKKIAWREAKAINKSKKDLLIDSFKKESVLSVSEKEALKEVVLDGRI